MACNIKSYFNQGPSILGGKLYEIFKGDSKEADRTYNYFQSKAFTHGPDGFGNWMLGESKLETTVDYNNRLDDNGEPLLMLDEASGLHYYLDRNYNKRFYPISRNKLEGLLSSNVINSITEALTMDLINEVIIKRAEGTDKDKGSELDPSVFENLENFIEEHLSLYVEAWDSSNDLSHMGYIMGVEESMDALSEWAQLVRDQLARNHGEIIDISRTDIMDHASENTRSNPSWDTASYEISAKEHVDSDIKFILSTLVDSSRFDPVMNRERYASFDEVFSDLSNLLMNTPNKQGTKYEAMVGRMQELAHKKPYLNPLINKLEALYNNGDEFLISKFVNTFNMTGQTFIGAELSVEEVTDTKTGRVTKIPRFTFKDLTNISSPARSFRNNWFFNFTKFYKNADNNYNFSKIKNLKSVIYDFARNTPNEDIISKETGELTDVGQAKLLRVLSNLGVELRKNIRESDGKEIYPELNHFLDGLTPQSQGYETRLSNLTGLKSSLEHFADLYLNKDFLETYKNPFDDQTRLVELSEAVSFYQGEDTDASIWYAGKSKYKNSNKSHLHTVLDEWKANPSELQAHLESDVFYNRSVLGELLLNNPEAFDNFKITLFNNFQREGEAEYSDDSGSISKLDLTLVTFNQVLGFKKSGGISYLSTPVPADKKTYYSFAVPAEFMSNTNARFLSDGKVAINQDSLFDLYGYVLDEYARIEKVTSELENPVGKNLRVYYHYMYNKETGRWDIPGNGTKFQLFEGLNEPTENLNYLYSDGKLKTDLVFLEREAMKDMTEQEIKEQNPHTHQLLEYLKNSISKQITDAYIRFEDEGTLGLMDKSIVDTYEGSDSLKSLKIVSDVYINSLRGYVEYAKLFSGDYAYYKNMMDYKKRVPSTYTDGTYLNLLRTDAEHYYAGVISNVEAGLTAYEATAELIGRDLASKVYKKGIDTTDAQAWINQDRWRFILTKAGKWNKKIYDPIWEKMEGRNNEPFTNDELLHLAQPLKGVYFHVVDGVPTYFKYSQAVLTKALLSNSPELQRIQDMMDGAKDENGVSRPLDEIITLSGTKSGATIPTDTHIKTSTTEIGHVREALRSGEHIVAGKYSNYHYKIQQDLPSKGLGMSDVGSQVLMMAQAAVTQPLLAGNYTVGDKQMSGEQALTQLNTTVSKMSNDGFKTLLNTIGADAEGNIKDISVLYEQLIKSMEARKGTPTNALKALRESISPYALPGVYDKIQQSFASDVRKNVSRVKTFGGSFIQMADYGLTKAEANNKGVIWMPWSDDKAHAPQYLKDSEGNRLYHEYVDESTGKVKRVPRVRPGGIFITGSFLDKALPGWRDKLEGMPHSAMGEWIKEHIDEEILRTVVGYRIPTQGAASVDALEIIGILPSENADTVVSYNGITAKTGSDFDIDKMYLMMPSFRRDFKSKKDLTDALYKVFKGYGKDINVRNKKILELAYDIGHEYLGGLNPAELADIDARGSDVSIVPSMEILIEALINEDNPNVEKIAKGLGIEKYLADSKKDTSIKIDKDADATTLVQTMHSIMSHPDAMRDIMTPIDHMYIKDDIMNLFPEEVSKDADAFNVYKEIDLRSGLLMGTVGVGASANHGKDHIRGLNADNSVGSAMYKFDVFTSEKLSSEDLAYYAEKTGLTLSEVKALESLRVQDSLSAIMNAMVDIANDDYIARAGWNQLSMGIGMTLLRMGVHPFKVNAFLSNPLIRDYMEFAAREESISIDNSGAIFRKFTEELGARELKYIKIGDVSVYDMHKEVGFVNARSLKKFIGGKVPDRVNLKDIAKLINKHRKKYGIIPAPGEEGTVNFIDYRRSLEYLREAVHVENAPVQDNIELLYDFHKLTAITKDVQDQMVATKPDTYSYGQDPTAMLIAENSLLNALRSENFHGFTSKLSFGGEPTYLATALHNTLFRTGNMMRKNLNMFIESHPVVKNTYNYISLASNKGLLVDEKLGRKIKNAYFTHLMSGFDPFKMDASTKEQILIGLPHMLKEVKDRYEAQGHRNALLENLEFKTNKKGDHFISMTNRDRSPRVSNDITNSWKDLFISEPELAEGLVKYSFLTTGFNQTISQFFTYIPYEFFSQRGINTYINEHVAKLQESADSVDMNFIESFFESNLHDRSIVKSISAKDAAIQKIDGISEFAAITLTPKELGEVENMYISVYSYVYNQASGTSKKVENQYKFKGFDESNNLIYTRAYPLGVRGPDTISVTGYNIAAKEQTKETVSDIVKQDLAKVEQLDYISHDFLYGHDNNIITILEAFPGFKEFEIRDVDLPKGFYTNPRMVEVLDDQTILGENLNIDKKNLSLFTRPFEEKMKDLMDFKESAMVVDKATGKPRLKSLGGEYTHYFDGETGTPLERTTRFYNPKELDVENPNLKSAINIGNKTEVLIKDFLTGRKLKDLSAYEIVSREDGDKIQKFHDEDLQSIKGDLDALGIEVIADDVIIKELKAEYGGEIDILGRNEFGTLYIIDVKTMKRDNFHLNQYGSMEWFSDYFGMSKQENYSKQMSMYRMALENTFGFTVARQFLTINIVTPHEAGDNFARDLRYGGLYTGLDVYNHIKGEGDNAGKIAKHHSGDKTNADLGEVTSQEQFIDRCNK